MKNVRLSPIVYLSVSLALALAMAVVFAYYWIDRSISLAYVEQSAEDSARSNRNLELLLIAEWNGMPKSVVLRKLEQTAKRHPPGAIVIKEDRDGIVWFEDTSFHFSNGKLIRIGVK